jgi:N-acetyl-1-D-myo-inositol-2-amino-2-deoxy-alpha-D-glucopyranoside deacetylase
MVCTGEEKSNPVKNWHQEGGLFLIRQRKGRGRVLAVAVVLLLLVGWWFRPQLADYLGNLLPGRVQEKIGENKIFSQQLGGAAFTVGERTLIISPHPDDETLGGAGVIEKALAAGKQVKVVIMTSGDGYERAAEANLHVEKPGPADFRRFGEMRHQESVAAMEYFGVKKEDVLFLGYPDGGVNGMWEDNWDLNNLHKGLNGAVRSPYDFAYEKNAPYCGVNVVKNLTAILQGFKPTDILLPDPNDQHHDHWGTQAFVKYVLTQTGYKAKEWSYLVHRGDFPAPWMYRPTLPLHPPYALRNVGTEWIALPMSKEEEEKKHGALKKYPSQTKVMDPFLEAFVRTNELLGRFNDPVMQKVAGELNVAKDVDQSPHFFFHDAYADTVSREIDPAADIVAFGTTVSDNSFWVGLETKAAINPGIHYMVRARIFRSEGVQRFDLDVHGTKVVEKHYASNSIDHSKVAIAHTAQNRFWVQLPKSVLGDAKRVMISVDTTDGKKHIDKTAWRLVKVTQ